MPVDYRRADPVEQIRELRRSAGLPPGEHEPDGVQAGIDAVGFQAHDRTTPGVENPGRIVSHHGGLTDAPRFHDEFDRRANGVIKAVLRP